ncbi:hypothetical protein D3C75_1229400 [compost metagenome]
MYYVSGGATHSWAIRETPNDLDTKNGLIDEISRIKDETGVPIIVTNWKKLKSSVE